MSAGFGSERAPSKGSASQPLAAFERGLDALFAGSVRSWVYETLRIGVAAIFIVRHADWLRPWVFLEHHRFVRGLMFLEPSPEEPRLLSPIVPGFALDDGTTRLLVFVRTALSVCLLLGVRARQAAGLLALVSYALLLSDRYRYYHHLHFLYVSLAFLALCPVGASLSLETGARRLIATFRSGARAAPSQSLLALAPFWPLALIRALVLGVYLAAGISKIDASWLAGDALRELERFHVLKGAVWEAVRDLTGYGLVAKLSLATELLLPFGLLLPGARRVAVVGGFAFHAGISACMPVYSFGAQMAVLLLAFWPVAERAGAATAGFEGLICRRKAGRSALGLVWRV